MQKEDNTRGGGAAGVRAPEGERLAEIMRDAWLVGDDTASLDDNPDAVARRVGSVAIVIDHAEGPRAWVQVMGTVSPIAGGWFEAWMAGADEPIGRFPELEPAVMYLAWALIGGDPVVAFLP